jgi:hypothetical protein
VPLGAASRAEEGDSQIPVIRRWRGEPVKSTLCCRSRSAPVRAESTRKRA